MRGLDLVGWFGAGVGLESGWSRAGVGLELRQAESKTREII